MSSSPVHSTPARILIVDDDEGIREFLKLVLGKEGFETEVVCSGMEAVERIPGSSYDLVLLDIWMPGMNGLEVLAALKGKVIPPVIVITSDTTSEVMLNAIREQATDFLRKPFLPQEVVDRVQAALAAAQSDITVISARPDWFELSVPCRREMADRVHGFIAYLQSDLDRDTRDAIGHAFRELLLNAIEWGGQLDPHRQVRIAYIRTGRLVIYRIADPGEGFRLEDLSHAAIGNPADDPLHHVRVRDEKGLRPGGLGLTMVRAIADELIYNEAHNEVLFVKYLNAAE